MAAGDSLIRNLVYTFSVSFSRGLLLKVLTSQECHLPFVCRERPFFPMSTEIARTPQVVDGKVLEVPSLGD